MGDTFTYYLGFIKPEIGGSDDTWGEKLHANFDKMDLLLGTGSLDNTPSKIYVDDADNLRVLKSGDTMTGFLTLHLDPTSPFHAATKQYVDAVSTVLAALTTIVNGKVEKAGDTMTGLLVLSANPAAPLGAATKQYVDAVSAITLTAGAGLTGGGDLTANRTFNVGAGTGISVAADTVGLDTAHSRNVDHSAVSVTAGAGLSGGGTIDANRTLSLDTASTRNVDHAGVSINAGTGLTGGGDITANRTLSLANAASQTIKSNITGGAAAPIDNTLTAILDAILGATRGMIMRRGAAAWQALALGTTGQVLKSDGTDIVYGTVNASGGGYPTRVRSTNLLAYPYFNDMPWTWTKANADMINPSYNTSEPITSTFGNRWLQIASAGGALNVAHPSDFRVDKTKAYQIGFWGFGGGTVNFKIASLNGISQEISTTTVSAVAVPASPVGLITGGGNNTGNVMFTMQPTAGAAPKWDAAAVGATYRVERPSGNMFMGGAYVVAHDHWPANISVGSVPAQANGGIGTHEAAYDSSNGMLYVVSHSFNTVIKYDTANNLQKPASNFFQTTSAYPHDITILGGHIYAACFNGNMIDKFDKTTMAIVSNTPLGRAGISICNNGTDIFIGAGTPAETSFIIKLTVATMTTGLISGDCGGGLANLPVMFIPASTTEIWTIKTANSEVKRINTGSGATNATYACNMGAIYGLGYDSINNRVYANCDDGVVVIDPTAATPGGVGTVLKKYMFRFLYGGASNIRMDDFGRMWGCTNSGVFMIDPATNRMYEMPTGFLGGPKWVHNIPGQGMALGYYAMPSIDIMV